MGGARPSTPGSHGPARGFLPGPPDVYVHVCGDVGGLGHHGWLRGLRFTGACRLLRTWLLRRCLIARASRTAGLHHRPAGRPHGLAAGRRSGLHLAPDPGARLCHRHADLHLRRPALDARPEERDGRKPGAVSAAARSAGEPGHRPLLLRHAGPAGDRHPGLDRDPAVEVRPGADRDPGGRREGRSLRRQYVAVQDPGICDQCLVCGYRGRPARAVPQLRGSGPGVRAHHHPQPDHHEPLR